MCQGLRLFFALVVLAISVVLACFVGSWFDATHPDEQTIFARERERVADIEESQATEALPPEDLPQPSPPSQAHEQGARNEAAGGGQTVTPASGALEAADESRSAMLSVRVVGPDHRPAPGYAVEAQGPFSPVLKDGGSGVTDHDGQWRTPALRAGSVEVVVRSVTTPHHHLARARFEFDPQSPRLVEIRLPPTGALSITRPEGWTDGLEVRIALTDGPAPSPKRTEPMREGDVLRLPALPVGEYLVRLHSKALITREQAVLVQAGAVTELAEVSPGHGRVTLLLLDAEGVPLVSETLTFFAGLSRDDAGGFSAVGNDGRATLHGSAAGGWRLNVFCRDRGGRSRGAPYSNVAVELAGGAETLTVQLPQADPSWKPAEDD